MNVGPLYVPGAKRCHERGKQPQRGMSSNASFRRLMAYVFRASRLPIGIRARSAGTCSLRHHCRARRALGHEVDPAAGKVGHVETVLDARMTTSSAMA
jgi:hypothetical protein